MSDQQSQENLGIDLDSIQIDLEDVRALQREVNLIGDGEPQGWGDVSQETLDAVSATAQVCASLILLTAEGEDYFDAQVVAGVGTIAQLQALEAFEMMLRHLLTVGKSAVGGMAPRQELIDRRIGRVLELVDETDPD